MVDIGTPHIAGYSFDGKVAGMIMIYNAACEYFGLKAKFDVDSFLPPPPVPVLKVASQLIEEQELIRQAVEEIYDIKSDDFALRQILNMPQGKRCALFDKLRKDYPVRSEFQNTQIKLTVPCKAIALKFTDIGFRIKNV